MKIAFDAKRAFRNYSGLGNYSRTVISLLTKYFPENEYLLYTPKTGYRGTGFPPAESRIVTPESHLHRKLHSYWRSYHISKLLDIDRPDIYHGLSHELPRNIEKTGTASVVTIHDLIFFRFPELYKAIDRKIYTRKWQHAARTADRIIAISEQTQLDICNYLDVDEKKIIVIYQSADPVYEKKIGKELKIQLRKKYSLPDNFILSLGTIEERKNLLEILKAMHAGKTTIPLVVIGREKKKYAEKVYAYIRDNQMKNIIFLKNVPADDIPGIYQCADLFIYPSRFEGFGLPVLEAVKSGVPVIAATGSCLEETGGPDSVYINPYNTEEFAFQIKRILDDSTLRENMVSRGLKFAAKFNGEKFAGELMKLYKEIQNDREGN